MLHCVCVCVCVDRTEEVEESLGPVKLQSTIIFDLVVLSQLANTSKAVIEVYTVSFSQPLISLRESG